MGWVVNVWTDFFWFRTRLVEVCFEHRVEPLDTRVGNLLDGRVTVSLSIRVVFHGVTFICKDSERE